MKSLKENFDSLDFKEATTEQANESDQALKLDFSSEKGLKICKDILTQIEKLFINYCGEQSKNDRSYRDKFSVAYKNLYKRNGGYE